ncbi:hypothetical protein ACQX8L_14155, partial [Staphylococcus aureus]|uniref:hypothetical protein n=1 Tax=Staphylococcus aureus TaxID=1280 RepID=UPI003D194FD3
MLRFARIDGGYDVHCIPTSASPESRPMPLDRRSLLASLCWMAASPALAADALPELESYERETGG